MSSKKLTESPGDGKSSKAPPSNFRYLTNSDIDSTTPVPTDDTTLQLYRCPLQQAYAERRSRDRMRAGLQAI
jgi:hypothetical protein